MGEGEAGWLWDGMEPKEAAYAPLGWPWAAVRKALSADAHAARLLSVKQLQRDVATWKVLHSERQHRLSNVMVFVGFPPQLLTD